MRTGLPVNHGLPPELLASSLLHRDELNQVSLTDVQFAALESGVAVGRNILAIAPTSSGKTDVGFYAASGWLHRGLSDGAKVVFLTSHRALARQKFAELLFRFAPLFTLTLDEMVLATGDDVIDGNGDPVLDALSGSVIVATYEKYLNILAGVGMQTDVSDICFIADEIQLIGDATRGQNVEILLTILRRSAGQIVGLSAVIENQYATQLASWLHAELVRTGTREVELLYELRTPNHTYRSSTEHEGAPGMSPSEAMGTIETLRILLQEGSAHEPIAVFCMSKRQVFALAEAWEEEARRLGSSTRVDDLPLFREPTASADELSRYLPHSFAYHTADLNEDERIAVEARLNDSNLKVVFATTTLASGLNYSFKTVIIHAWQRWDTKRRTYSPISRSEFHNMAGRAGRLSHVETAGRVIFFASTSQEIRLAGRYLSWWEFDEFAPRIDPAGFSGLSLQLLAAQVANDKDSLCEFLQGTFSAERELERNASQPQLWADAVERSLGELAEWGFVA